MNYRHSYHAGNFADVFKHVVMLELLHSLRQKESGFYYLETHAGRGCYDLSSVEAEKSKEYLTGIARVMTEPHPPSAMNTYLSVIKQLNPSSQIKRYPGSPYLARALLRPQDRMVLCELQTDEANALRHLFRQDKQISIHHQEGYLGLRAFIPPRERRGLVMIDPPYEKHDDMTQMAKRLADALTRWETGIYAIWYPIKDKQHRVRLHRDITDRIQRPLLAIDFCILPDDVPTFLNGCGMLIINPPWQMERTLTPTLAWLWHTLSVNQQGYYRLSSLT